MGHLKGEMDQGRRRVEGAVGVGLEWRALGPVEVIVEGRLVDLGPPTQRGLFGLLLSRVDQPVTLDALVDQLWSGDPPPAAMASLRAYVSNLRRVLEPRRPPRAPAAVLRTVAPGYLLDSRGVEFDARRFTAHASAGRTALDHADPQRAVAEFDAALGLWRGQAYADMRDATWAAPEMGRLEELRLSVVEDRCGALLQVGAHDVVATELEVHVRAHPLRERGCELRALALYRAGRQADALAVLRATRARLAEELGLDPGAALQRLEHDILTHNPALDWRPATAMLTAPGTGHSDGPLVRTIMDTDVRLQSSDERSVREDQRLVSTQAQILTSQSVMWPHQVGSVPLLADCYQHRDVPAARLDEAVKTGTVVLTQVLSGLGGVGKTQLAASFARKAWAQGSVELLVWATASSRAAVQATYAQAATEIGQLRGQDVERAAEWFVGWLQTTNRS
ncbi:MAG: AfsR/SARP family transcriptional regulator, partial [Pseudonocardiales bacterium]|nr:AfsR/SARP family transcriptional regulator [Pseudonocardiales bacterium]